ncbi:transcriptional regulator, GntR family [Cellulomonas flavigena DSM 20109]|uniref:Transcriptional regulator, GntR family n=1 Tax=Cellulomonas flavigena (strain ATCC 482 / DSM 20109 / BCRC 11376 / JCM 18109 / NBRC 3775 / NCIMB 8073 / NRS 134) TaxID=446466 RepID=D5UCV8_CELFN|nr:GntR family transcriptional regulator [Cellulomonas flavigena]ADG76343.1 transcriptional regulator, GntR family [Cellulomonas flavigena DSM 20109]
MTAHSTAAGPTAARTLARTLREAVLDGRLTPGEPLREEALAAAHGVSRHTVRAALAALAAERLVAVQEYRGARVARLTDAEVRSLQDLRAALECEAVRILGERHPAAWPAEVVAPVEQALAALTAADPGDWPAVQRAHAGVHLALVAAAGSPRLTDAYAALGAEVALLLLHARTRYDVPALVDEHTAYLADVQRRGPVAVRAHLTHLADLLHPPA